MEDDMELIPQQSHLFTLRVWMVNGDHAAPTWRARLQNIQSGEVNYCRDWNALIACIEEALREQNHKSVSD
ncbi:MAG: hypothetical protein CO094_02685 [Anaerolineae bacterium CG_4_9_14_3_um_filter_57_17]|nr:MAG: hypothetical protein CO094_02685 [Anaerolineae bacterium CG_4_9_14_3_um_filter_57_17]